MTHTLGPIHSESVIVIIGGGPAGSACALKLQQLAEKNQIHPRIILYEGKRFEKKSYYNQCIGVLSPPLQDILEKDLGIPFPWNLVLRTINGYEVHSENKSLHLSGTHDPSYASRRVEFDNYLFQWAQQRGIETFATRVTDLELHPDGVMVFSESNNIKADVVVGAFGLDDGMAKAFERITPYRQPHFLSTIVTKVHPRETCMTQFGDIIYAFLPTSLPHVEFGAVTPKGNHLSVNIAGERVDAAMMDRFLRLPAVQEAMPCDLDGTLEDLYYFKGKFPNLPAKAFFGDRYVMVGDASGLIRPFKGKGINAAVITGIKAAEAMIQEGISKASFCHYLDNCHELTRDILPGKIMRYLTKTASRLGLLDSALEVAKSDPPMQKAIFNVVSAQETYQKTWKDAGGFPFLFRIGMKTLRQKLFPAKT
jgi:flavin-dependent dehydrogenase